jgi:hypothetical protein
MKGNVYLINRHFVSHSRKMEVNVAGMGDIRNEYKFLIGNSERKIPLVKSKCK